MERKTSPPQERDNERMSDSFKWRWSVGQSPGGNKGIGPCENMNNMFEIHFEFPHFVVSRQDKTFLYSFFVYLLHGR